MPRRAVILTGVAAIVGVFIAPILAPLILVGGSALFFGAGDIASNPCIVNASMVSPGTITVSSSIITIDGVRLDTTQQVNAKTIAIIGKQRGFSTYDIAIAIATSYQESDLNNIRYGDRDSLGLFQQRFSQGWGSPDQIMNPVYATNKFYDALARVTNRASMSMVEVAIEVQRPNPTAYYSRWRWDNLGKVLAARYAPGASTSAITTNLRFPQQLLSLDGCQDSLGNLGAVIQAAISQVGVPYLWGGETPGAGFDCSGLVWWAYQRGGVTLPRTAQAQYDAGLKQPGANMVAGDLVYYSSSGSTSNITHVTMYLGNQKMIEAPYTGADVRITPLRNDYVGVTRPIPSPSSMGLQLGGWQNPLPSGYYISSRFSLSRVHPITGVRKAHTGTDLAMACGTPIRAASSGIVKSAGWVIGNGNYLVIEHGAGIKTAYAHLNGFAPGMQPGASVTGGSNVGYVGSTGYSTGCHLHYETIVGGNFVDPEKFMAMRGIKL